MLEQSTTASTPINTRCCVVGGGPAGMMHAYLLARAGVDVVVLEKHGDFLRDFRGDTVHPSTLEVIHELGLLEDFLKRPHQEALQLTGYVENTPFIMADFSHLPTTCKFIAFMPQWDFLDFLADHARAFPNFHLHMRAEATDLIEENGRIVGVKAKTPNGPLDVRADLVVAADGRHSVIRERAGLTVLDIGAPMDVLWLRIRRSENDPKYALGRFSNGRILVMIDRGDYWQIGYVIPKGDFEQIQREGLERFRANIAEAAPFVHDRVHEIQSWDNVRLLTVAVDRLQKWYREGLLCIGDAAHAMSPVGGVGINLAIQDAVAAANILAEKLRLNTVTISDLAKVQRRREFPTRVTQALQVLVQNRVIRSTLTAQQSLSPPLMLRMFQRFPFLRRIPARLIGIGIRPEHVRVNSK